MNRYRRTEPHNIAVEGGNSQGVQVNGDLIGVGAYAKVYRGIDSWTNNNVALKILNCGEPGVS
jgi:RIO-like serine/threonine protein kinase